MSHLRAGWIRQVATRWFGPIRWQKRHSARPSRSAAARLRVRPRLDPCEDFVLPNDLLLATSPLLGAAIATAAAPESSGGASCLLALQSEVSVDYRSDTDAAASYNAVMANSAAGQLELADAMPEARPAMTHLSFDNPEPPEPLPAPQAERPLAPLPTGLLQTVAAEV